jgi:hypothetical protein
LPARQDLQMSHTVWMNFKFRTYSKQKNEVASPSRVSEKPAYFPTIKKE